MKWVADLGSQTYGNATVAGGRVFVGTNNELLRDPKQAGDRGVLMAFKQDTGEFLWQNTHEKVSAGRVNDWPFQGVASSRLVEGDRYYYVSNRGEVMCLDVEGFRDGAERRPGHRREVHRREGRRHRLEVRHDGGGRCLPAQPVELVAGDLRRSRLRA